MPVSFPGEFSMYLAKMTPLVVLTALVATGFGCSETVTLAVGPAGDITIVTELSENSPEVSALVESLQREVVVIRPEPAFNVEVSDPHGFKIRRNWRNLVFLGSLDDGSWIKRKIESLLDEDQRMELVEGRRNLFLMRDNWALGQLVVVLASAERDSLAQVVKSNTRALYGAFERAAVENTKRILLKRGFQRDTARYLSRKYGWSIKVPDEFDVTEDAEARIVLFRAQEPARMILVHWVDGHGKEITRDECLTLRAKLAWNIYDEDTIAPDMTETEETVFLGRKAVKIVGVWQNEKHVNGGPFRTFCFVESGKLYLVDVLVYAPDMDKLPYLRELEAIARTFTAG